jgi:4-diphosphocytidyl-2-C-methyl-D-erythritol kinase
LGLNRGEQVVPLPDMPCTSCLIAVPNVGVSTPQAFRDWDAKGDALAPQNTLTAPVEHDRLMELSLAYASLYAEPGTSGIVRNLNPEKKQGSSDDVQRGVPNGLAENTLLSLVRTGVENDFEQVVFPAYPSLRETKRLLMGTDSEAPALYAALSGSGSALFGLYRSDAEARAAQQRIQSAATQAGVRTFLTETLPRAAYWQRMFAG